MDKQDKGDKMLVRSYVQKPGVPGKTPSSQWEITNCTISALRSELNIDTIESGLEGLPHHKAWLYTLMTLIGDDEVTQSQGFGDLYHQIRARSWTKSIEVQQSKDIVNLGSSIIAQITFEVSP